MSCAREVESLENHFQQQHGLHFNPHSHTCYGKMCSKLYSFCLVFIMVADCQEGPRKKVCVDCMDGLVHECDNEMCVV